MADGSIRGAQAIEALAERFPQLYVAPAEGAQEAHRAAAGRGIAPEGATLGHFSLDPADELREVDTPAGPVEVICFARRADFETFQQIIAHKSLPVPIAATIGATTYRGLADWGKVRAAYVAYKEAGGDDWPAEMARLSKVPGALRSELIVISSGPYSNIEAASTPYSQDEWIRMSKEIRLYHECAHVVCRRTRPEDILPVWDEVTADTVGLICATGKYDPALAALFLGVSEKGFEQGRLAEYLDEGQLDDIDAISREVYSALLRIAEMADGRRLSSPFDFLLELKEEPLIRY